MSTLGDWLQEEPYTLALSAGFFGFYAHTGVLLALEERGVLPEKLTGASAGALVAAAYGAGKAPGEIAAELETLERGDFWDPFPGPGLLRGRKFATRLERVLPVDTLEACRAPVAISVFDMFSRQTRVRTAGNIFDAVRASCALPGLFWPVKVEGRWSLDGGIKDPWGLAGTDPDERVLLHQLSEEGRAQVPDRAGLHAVVLRELPAVSPFKLHEGRRAIGDARARTLIALDQPRARVVRVDPAAVR